MRLWLCCRLPLRSRRLRHWVTFLSNSNNPCSATCPWVLPLPSSLNFPTITNTSSCTRCPREKCGQLADFMQIEVLNRQGQFTFFRRLLNFDDWRVAGRPQSTQFLDYQVVNSNIEAERDHLRVGDHIVRVLTMKEAITETPALALDALLKISANFRVVTEWTPLATDKARKEVNKRRRHFNMSKTGFVSRMGNDATKTNPRDVLVDESKQADIENLGDCLRALGDGQSLGDFSLTIVLYGRSKAELEQLGAKFTGIFTNADGNLFAETYNQLNAYFATVPGNYALNLRKLYLLNTNYAALSFLFTILPGEKTNAYLGTEYLAVLETDNSTPYFLNLHNGEVAHTLILGMTGSGKSYFCNFLLQNAQKYAPLTFIFDIGSSFQSLTTIFGGSYLNAGREARDFTINPFSLPQTKENLQFLFSFFRVLIEGNEQRYRLDFKEERRLWDAIERMYILEPTQRTVSNFTNILGELKERLHRWTRGGQYGFLFDNAEDTLSFSRFQTFNFHSWNDAPEVLEPLLFYVLHRASNEIGDPKKLATFKIFLLDEAWLFIKNETIRNYVVQAQKTWRKHNAAMILATQSIKELEESGNIDPSSAKATQPNKDTIPPTTQTNRNSTGCGSGPAMSLAVRKIEEPMIPLARSRTESRRERLRTSVGRDSGCVLSGAGETAGIFIDYQSLISSE